MKVWHNHHSMLVGVFFFQGNVLWLWWNNHCLTLFTTTASSSSFLKFLPIAEQDRVAVHPYLFGLDHSNVTWAWFLPIEVDHFPLAPVQSVLNSVSSIWQFLNYLEGSCTFKIMLLSGAFLCYCWMQPNKVTWL